ncbi:MAG: hypothetical protein FJ291_15445 [Planctomycetes bacterium]|nr:hypothetical protein [Planctomycetota bacterium]
MTNSLEGMAHFAARITDAARRAGGSELKLQGEVDGLLRETLARFDIAYDPIVDQSLSRSCASSGRPDSLFGHVVLDYKAPGALQQGWRVHNAKSKIVTGYLRPLCESGGALDPAEAARWVGVLTDGRHITFAVFDGVSEWDWTPLRPINKFSVTTWVQYYRALHRKPLDPYLLGGGFGRETPWARDCIRVLAEYLMKPTPRTNMLFREWRRMFEQVSTYELGQVPALASWAKRLGLPRREDPAAILFCLHTYYALIVKLLTAELLTASRRWGSESFLEKLAHAENGRGFLAELRQLEDGRVYRDLGIANFLEGDFFVWYLQQFDGNLEAALRRIVEVFRNYEPATPKLNPSRCRDLLKVFYSNVIDEEIRHDLGEYYTPDWLAEVVLDRVGYRGDLHAQVLDPACGSGTFLILAIQRFLKQAARRGLPASEIVSRVRNQIKGFDLNPLAVISARANYLLALAEHLTEYGGPLEIPVYLCDSINVPLREQAHGIDCLAYTLDTEVGDRTIRLPESLVRSGVIGNVLLLAERHIAGRGGLPAFMEAVHGDPAVASLIGSQEEEVLAEFYGTVEELEGRGWNEIWCRIVKNHFASAAVSGADFIVGNPPWVRWSRLPTAYRRRCKAFCTHYGLVSGRGYAGGIESDISTVMTYSAVDNWLRPGGKIGFLLTATVYKTDSATGFRKFRLPPPEGTPIFPESIDDLVALNPFPDARNETSLLVARKGDEGQETAPIYPASGVPYTVWTRRANGPRVETSHSLEQVLDRTLRQELRAVPITEVGSPLFTGSAADIEAIPRFRGRSPYLEQAHKGTTTDLSRVYWVKVLAYDADRDLAKIRTLSQAELGGAKSEGIVTTAGMWIEAGLLYPLIRGRDLGRFCYATAGWHILVPNEHYDHMEEAREFRARCPRAYEYLQRNEVPLRNRSSYRRYQRHRPFYAIYDVGPYTFSHFKVAWMEIQNPREFRAAVVGLHASSPLPNRVIVPDHKLYMLSTEDEDEAHYVCGVLNSKHMRRVLGGFLVGKQTSSTPFRYVRIPLFHPRNPTHTRIAGLSKTAHAVRANARSTNDLEPEEQGQLEEAVLSLFS